MFNMIVIYRLFCILLTFASVLCQDSVSNDDAKAIIVNRQFDDSNLDVGVYNYGYETSNGISRHEESSSTKKAKSDEFIQRVAGSYAYVGPDGIRYEVKYTADETGFYPVGAHFKTPKVSPWPAQNTLEDDGSSNSGLHLVSSSDSSSLAQEDKAFINISQSGSLSSVSSQMDQMNVMELFLTSNGSGSSSVSMNEEDSGKVSNLYVPPPPVVTSTDSKNVANLYIPPPAPVVATSTDNKNINSLYLPPAPDADVINLLQFQSNEIDKEIKARAAIYDYNYIRDIANSDPLQGSASQVVFYVTKPRGFSMLSRSKPRGFSLQS